MTATARQQLQFLAALQRILNEGAFVATYKYALLRVLAELSIERTPDRDGTLLLSMNDLAERFIEIYWRQAAPFRHRRTLVQSTGNQAWLVARLLAMRARVSRIADARRTPQWGRLVRRTRTLLLEQPLWRLQRIGDERIECFYVHRLEDDAIRLEPGVAACFKAQFPVVQALVQLAWLRMVQQLPVNQDLIGQGGDVAQFLFGADRSAVSRLSGSLLEIQSGGCFYCGGRIQAEGQVDHFIPWVRYQRDLGHNFVLAHDRCNGRKRDFLAAVPYLARWLARNDARRAELDSIFSQVKVLHDAETTSQVAAWSYEQVEHSGGLVWAGADRFEHLTDAWRTCFSR